MQLWGIFKNLTRKQDETIEQQHQNVPKLRIPLVLMKKIKYNSPFFRAHYCCLNISIIANMIQTYVLKLVLETYKINYVK